MKRSTAQLLLPIIKAYAEGAEIEWQRKDTGTPCQWYPCKENPEWIEENNYRIKPEKVKHAISAIPSTERL